MRTFIHGASYGGRCFESLHKFHGRISNLYGGGDFASMDLKASSIEVGRRAYRGPGNLLVTPIALVPPSMEVFLRPWM